MKNINILIVGGLLAGALLFSVMPASADHKEEKEDHGWLALFCTDPDASVVEILEAFADRATIEVNV